MQQPHTFWLKEKDNIEEPSFEETLEMTKQSVLSSIRTFNVDRIEFELRYLLKKAVNDTQKKTVYDLGEELFMKKSEDNKSPFITESILTKQNAWKAEAEKESLNFPSSLRK